MSVLLAPQSPDTLPSDLPEVEPETRIESPADTGIRVRRWTRREFHWASSHGFFQPGERIELIEGELIERMGENPPHVVALKLVEAALARTFSLLDCHLHSQHPIALPNDTEPEPDVAVVQGNIRAYESRHPAATDVLLVVEVSDTTLGYDRNRKGLLYAAAGIPEYWIVNLSERRLEVFRTPLNGSYQVILSLGESQTIAPLAVPDQTISVADLLPAPATPAAP